MAEQIFIYAGFGFLGGFTRAVIGLLKLYTPKKRGEVKPLYMLISLLGSGIIGIFAALVISTSFPLAILAGYAGTDFIENIYKLRIKGKAIQAK
ncbi:hypothetical protein HY483_02250 [Candidatus Woesearchaeota archaeon]|nr:hypothetical protein [Candidatus Woesearchaeota archaeon]